MADYILIEGMTAKLFARPESITGLFYAGETAIQVIVDNRMFYIEMETKNEATAAFEFIKRQMQSY